MSERLWPRFQDSLMAGKIIQDKDVAYYAYWVSRFLAFANKNQDMKLRDRDHYLLFTNEFVVCVEKSNFLSIFQAPIKTI